MDRKITFTPVSGRIIAAMSALLVLLAVSVILIIYSINEIEQDASLINNAGKVRGGIQRIVKNELAGKPVDGDIARLDEIMSYFMFHGYSQNQVYSESEKFNAAMHAVEGEWQRLVLLIRDYREHKTRERAEMVFSVSEKIWEMTDDAVSIAEFTSRRKIRYFYLLASVATLSFAIMIGLIFFTKTHVRDRIEFYASHDALTGIYNRSSFMRMIERECVLSARTGRGFSLIMFDIDHFKSINDSYGHDVGDIVLRGLGSVMHQTIRESDFFARIGGEEFAILVSDSDRDRLFLFAEKIRMAVERARLHEKVHLTISSGIATYMPDDLPALIMKRADRALYRAKSKGRNRVEMG
ncbi:MAG TPA: GGDEF domain-containing protein [Spirochaetota bacterium]